MSPMQLYYVGRDVDDFSSQSEDESHQASIGQLQDTLASMTTEAVEVSNLHFCPCVASYPGRSNNK